jgi:hypothetical protein
MIIGPNNVAQYFVPNNGRSISSRSRSEREGKEVRIARLTPVSLLQGVVPILRLLGQVKNDLFTSRCLYQAMEP